MSQMTTGDMADRGLQEVQEQLRNIENILKAEQKRRVETNEIIDRYITDYLEQLQSSLSERVNS
jgi:hypothetical protein